MEFIHHCSSTYDAFTAQRVIIRIIINVNFRSRLQISLTIVAVVILALNSNGRLMSNLKKATETSTVDVSEFVSYCNSFQTLYSDSEKIESTLACSRMVGLRVHWNGRVVRTKITNIHNPIASIVDKLPAVSVTIYDSAG